MTGNYGRVLLLGIIITLASLALVSPVAAEDEVTISQPESVTAPAPETLSPQSLSSGLELAAVLVGVTLVPMILLLTTSFVRIVVVLALLRHGLGSQHLPPTTVLIGLSLLLTFVVMTPVWEEVHREALQPLLAKEATPIEASQKALKPMRTFMLNNVRQADLQLFLNLNQSPPVTAPEEAPTRLLLPSFVISELNIAFQLGFRILLPFLIIDMVVAAALASLGVFMLPPAMISLPFKLLLFILADGWRLVVGTLLTSFN